jgi:ABC-type lipoprotein release transport system permease subunit
VTAVRRRRRDLALLKTLGFDRAQVRATILIAFFPARAAAQTRPAVALRSE